MTSFRTAREASTAWYLASTLLQIALFWGTFLWLLPAAIHELAATLGLAPTPWPGHRTTGATMFSLASALGLWSAWHMAVRGRGTPLPLATAREFVVTGPYRWLRNPMALAGIAQGVAVGIWLADLAVVGYALCGALLWHFAARPPEERDLEQRFGEPFRRYRAAVPLWRPARRPYRP